MSDWPSALVTPSSQIIHTFSVACGYGQHAIVGGSTGAVWPAANRAIFIPFTVESPVTATQIAIDVTVQSGNLDVGLYDINANRLVSMGSTAVAVAGLQVLDIADTLLAPGTYFMAMCVDNTTAAVVRNSNPDIQTLRVAGVQQQALGSVALPNPATFANPASAYVPTMSIVTVPTI